MYKTTVKSLKQSIEFAPGILSALLVAIISVRIESLFSVHIIGASVIALFIGITLNHFKSPSTRMKLGLAFTSKKILKLAIILLGASLSVGAIIHVGRISLIVMCFTLLTCFGGGYFIGRRLGLNWKLSNLISAGTGICGGSAIAAIAPVIESEDSDIAYAMSATFLFDIIMIILFPLMGKLLGLSDMAYGLWAGTAVNDTSSVVAAGYAFSESAGDFATMVKLTRTLAIIPVVLIFSYINTRSKARNSDEDLDYELKASKISSISSVFPFFILGFLALAAVNSLGLIPPSISQSLKEVSKFLMIMALAAIGLNTSFRDMKSSGLAPMIHGFLISLLVVLVALLVEVGMGIV